MKAQNKEEKLAKQQEREKLQREIAAREKAELRALEIQSHQEKRVVNLESRLQELSSSVCSYEKLRVQDQMSMVALQEELEKLHHEKQTLVKTQSSDQDIEAKEENVNFRKIVDKVLKYKKLLLDAEEKEVGNLHEVFMMPDYLIKQQVLLWVCQIEQIQKQK